MFGPLGTEEVARGSPEPVEGNDPAWDLLQDLCLHRRRSCAVCADSVCKSHRKKALPKVLGESLCPGRPHVPPVLPAFTPTSHKLELSNRRNHD